MALSLSSSSQINANSSKLSQTNDAHTTAASMNGADCRIHIVMQTCIEFYAPAKCVNSQEAQSIPKSSVYHFSMFRIPSSTHNTYLLDSPHHTHTHSRIHGERARDMPAQLIIYNGLFFLHRTHKLLCSRCVSTCRRHRRRRSLCKHIIIYFLHTHNTSMGIYAFLKLPCANIPVDVCLRVCVRVCRSHSESLTFDCHKCSHVTSSRHSLLFVCVRASGQVKEWVCKLYVLLLSIFRFSFVCRCGIFGPSSHIWYVFFAYWRRSNGCLLYIVFCSICSLLLSRSFTFQRIQRARCAIRGRLCDLAKANKGS